MLKVMIMTALPLEIRAFASSGEIVRGSDSLVTICLYSARWARFSDD
jgi:hypothetical protein